MSGDYISKERVSEKNIAIFGKLHILLNFGISLCAVSNVYHRLILMWYYLDSIYQSRTKQMHLPQNMQITLIHVIRSVGN